MTNEGAVLNDATEALILNPALRTLHDLFTSLVSYQVKAYINAYAEHFDLLPHIMLRCRLIQLRPLPTISDACQANEAKTSVPLAQDGASGRAGWEVFFHDLSVDKFFKVRIRAPPHNFLQQSGGLGVGPCSIPALIFDCSVAMAIGYDRGK